MQKDVAKVLLLTAQWRELTRARKDKAAEIVRVEIIKEFQTNFNNYAPEFIIEALHYSGDGPCVICGKRGFVVVDYSRESLTSTGYYEYMFHVNESAGQLTIAAALKAYVDELDIG
jgi:hypothetical protein